MKRHFLPIVLLCTSALTAFAQATRTPAVNHSNSESWLSELLVEEMGIPKDSFSGPAGPLVQGYQERLNKLGADPAEMRKALTMMERGEFGNNAVELLEARKVIQSVREKGGDVFAELMIKLEPMTKPTAEQYVKMQRAREALDPAAPMIGDHIGQMDRVAIQLRDELGLDEEQAKVYDQALANMKESMEKVKIPEMLQKVSDAQRSGDVAAEQSARENLERILASQETLVTSFFAQVDPVLSEEQRTVMYEMRDRVTGVAYVGPDNTPQQDVKLILRAARSITVTREQRMQLDDLTRSTARTYREIGTDRGARNTLATAVKDEIRKILRPEQYTAFEQRLNDVTQRRSPSSPRAPEPPTRTGQPDSNPK